MKRIFLTIMLMAVFGSSAFAESPNRTCGKFNCDDLYGWIAADAIMALPGSAEAALEEDKHSSGEWNKSMDFVKGIDYSFCIKMNNPIEKCGFYNGYTERWKQGKAAGDKVWSLFESEGVAISYEINKSEMRSSVIHTYQVAKQYGAKFPQHELKVKAHQFNDNSSLPLEENIKNTIAMAKKMKEEWESKKDERVADRKVKEESRKAEFQAEHTRKLNETREDINREINAASKTSKGRLKVAMQIMCNAIRDYHDQTLDLKNPGGSIGREYRYNASKDVFFTMLESSGGNKYGRYSEDRDNYNRYCK